MLVCKTNLREHGDSSPSNHQLGGPVTWFIHLKGCTLLSRRTNVPFCLKVVIHVCHKMPTLSSATCLRGSAVTDVTTSGITPYLCSTRAVKGDY
eukprot:297183-Chlamydomonas_euryale.AAC.1